MLEKSFNAAVNLVPSIEVDKDALVDRICGRRMCKNGHVYHVVTKPPKEEGICDVCGEPLYQRDDDKEETVKTRLNAFEETTAKLIDYYDQKGVLSRINGNDAIDKVSEIVLAAVKAVIAEKND